MATLKPYRVNIGGRETVLRLTEETVNRNYPDAVELKIGAKPTTPEQPKATPRSRTKSTK
ncbi:hypothetical protein [Corynebacterium sp. p3-SID1194]|uniref:hypothetical protein n=1 Tax=Corynebacterium sp. p3-SID1194 TaxID=2916105 RepID=UPI0021A45971|nr:hypothetical protein [Corynebacterium sp. p3-SID1194]MCT1450642.1 hypothetical protein [Corynebacterium sp. p3-SID1194]